MPRYVEGDAVTAVIISRLWQELWHACDLVTLQRGY
jgi:hypothetical protein